MKGTLSLQVAIFTFQYRITLQRWSASHGTTSQTAESCGALLYHFIFKSSMNFPFSSIHIIRLFFLLRTAVEASMKFSSNCIHRLGIRLAVL